MFKRLFLAIVGIVALWLVYEWLTFPDVTVLADEAPKSTAFMELRRKQLRREGRDDTLLYDWVSYGRISPYLRRAVLVAEDNAFYEHSGVDVKAMQEAIKRDLKRKRITHGGSTITQQLAKNLYLSPSRNPVRKVKEYLIARSLENHLSKKRILELYLNVVEFGERVYGAEAAARYYFDKPASALTPQQAALLAGCLPNPRAMNPADPNRRLRARQHMILSRLRRWGYLYEREVLTAPKPAAQPAETETAAPPSDTDLTPQEDTQTTQTTETTTGTGAPSETAEPTSTSTAPQEPPPTGTTPVPEGTATTTTTAP